MVRKIVLGIGILVIAVMTVSAQDTTTTALTAEGSGTIALNGSGSITISGNGMLFIVDRTGDTQIDIEENRRYVHTERETRGNTVHTYRRFDGTATVSGEDMAVLMQGINLQVSVSGTGMMLLEGVGEFTLDDTLNEWSSDGVQISLGDVDENKKRRR